jgi:sugar-specific transcriptional regulator TrmB
MFFDDAVSILNRAGLTILQAKIYLTLVMGGNQSIKMIAKAANIDRANVYREIINLEKMALVKKIIGNPNIYDAIQFQDGISLLLKQKTDEYEKLLIATKKLAKHFSEKNTTNTIQDENKFTIVPKKAMFIKNALAAIQESQKSNDMITSLRRFSQAMPYFFNAQKTALMRGVRLRVIIEKPKVRTLSKNIQNLMNYQNFQLKYTTNTPKAIGACFDEKTASFIIDSTADITNSACLVTNHPSFITLFQNYFETLWNSAIPLIPSEIQKSPKIAIPQITPNNL